MSESIGDGKQGNWLATQRAVTILIAALLICCGTVGYILMSTSTVMTESLPIVEMGDHIYVDYVGMFVDNPGGWIFDTSIRSVAVDTGLVKALYFVKKSDTEYQPLNFSAGVSSKYLKGFVEGTLGMSVTQTKRIYIPAEDAYALRQENFLTYPLVQEIPIMQNITKDYFVESFRLQPSAGMVLTSADTFWEWNVTVWNVDGDKVTLQNMPTLGQNVSSYGDPDEDPRDGWYQQVIGIDTSGGFWGGKILVENKISSQDAFQKRGVDFDKRKFTLYSVDEQAGTFTIFYNSVDYIGELAGRALIFDITIVKILKAR